MGTTSLSSHSTFRPSRLADFVLRFSIRFTHATAKARQILPHKEIDLRSSAKRMVRSMNSSHSINQCCAERCLLKYRGHRYLCRSQRTRQKIRPIEIQRPQRADKKEYEYHTWQWAGIRRRVRAKHSPNLVVLVVQVEMHKIKRMQISPRKRANAVTIKSQVISLRNVGVGL